MAILISFLMLIISMIGMDIPVAMWLGQRHRKAHATIAITLVVMAITGWAMNTATAWYNSAPERLEVLKNEMVTQSERIIRLLNHPEDREAHPISEFTKNADLRRMVGAAQGGLIYVPRDAKVSPDMTGSTIYNVYMVFDDGVVLRQEKHMYFMYTGSRWLWVQDISTEPEEVTGAMDDEPGFREALNAWYNYD